MGKPSKIGGSTSQTETGVQTALNSTFEGKVRNALQRLPNVMICVSKSVRPLGSSTVTGTISNYDGFLSNKDTMGGETGQSMDLSSGIFICRVSGFYTITFSSYAGFNAGEIIELFLRRNGARVQETHSKHGAGSSIHSHVYSENTNS